APPGRRIPPSSLPSRAARAALHIAFSCSLCQSSPRRQLRQVTRRHLPLPCRCSSRRRRTVRRGCAREVPAVCLSIYSPWRRSRAAVTISSLNRLSRAVCLCGSDDLFVKLGVSFVLIRPRLTGSARILKFRCPAVNVVRSV
uniref:Uncharacterized protein n=1 Tax=Triticum urartu TaxID=4572 RepID=A0A8R7QRP1_TRIUA